MAVFSFIAGTAMWAGVTGAIGAAAAGALIAIGQAVTWSLASTALMSSKVSRQTVMANISQTDQPRIRAYGQNLLGGVRAFYETKDGGLLQIVVFHHGRVDGLIQFWVDGEPVVVGSDDKINRYTQLYFRDGAGDGGDYARVRERFPNLWTPAHRLTGQATFHTDFGDPADEKFAKFYPKGAQTLVQVAVRGALVPDFDGAPIYSDNAGLCIRDLMLHRDGWNIPLSRLDEASWRAFVALCAEPVLQLDGGSDDRYRIGGFYSLEDPLKDITGRMLATCDGQIYETADGKVGILGGAWSEPDVTIRAEDILEVDMLDGFDPMQDYNVLRGSFVSAAHKYQPIEVREIRNETALAMQEERNDLLDVDMCPSSSQIQRLMKIRFAKDHRAMTGTIKTNLVGMKARFPKGDGIHTIRIVAEEFGIDGVFEVTSHAFSVVDGFCVIGIASIDNPYGWHALLEEKPLPPSADDIKSPPSTDPVPAGAVLTQETVRVAGGIQGVKVVVEVLDPERDGLELRAQIGRINQVGGSVANWVDMPASQLRAESGILDDGAAYAVRIMWRGYGDWITVGQIAVVADPEPPQPPGDFSAMVVGSVVYLEWVNASTNYFRTQIYIGSGPLFSAAVPLATVAGTVGRADNYARDMGAATGGRFFWVRHLNASGVPSAPEGPVAVTIAPPDPPAS